MTSLSLAQSYLAKARARLGILKYLQEAKDYSDVVRESQEIVAAFTFSITEKIIR